MARKKKKALPTDSTTGPLLNIRLSERIDDMLQELIDHYTEEEMKTVSRSEMGRRCLVAGLKQLHRETFGER